MLKLENSIRGLSFSRVAFDLTIQDSKKLQYIDERIMMCEKQITPEELTGDPTKYARYRTVEIFRG